MRRIVIILTLLWVGYTLSFAQWTVVDPTQIGQNLANSIKQIAENSKITGNTLSTFQETLRIYEQSKQYYDALKAVNDLIKDARKVHATINMIQEITEIYIHSFQSMLSDPYFTMAELDAIAYGYAVLLDESAELLAELKQIINPSTLSMTDKDRIELIDKVYREVREYRNLVAYYTNKNISISYIRAKKKNDLERVFSLYGSFNEKYW